MRRPAGIEDVGIRPVSGKWADGCDEGSGRQARPACVEWLNWHDSGSVVGEVEDPLSKVGPWCVCESTSQSLNSLVAITLPELFVDDKRLCLLIDIFSTQDKASKPHGEPKSPKSPAWQIVAVNDISGANQILMSEGTLQHLIQDNSLLEHGDGLFSSTLTAPQYGLSTIFRTILLR